MLPTRTAHGGLTLPVIGFGTYRLTGADGIAPIQGAVDVGYTLVDSAFNYENEGVVGRAIRDSGRRADTIVTSKLPGRHHAFDEAMDTIQESVYRTGLDQIDLYLIHWPNPGVDRYVEAWRALIAAKAEGWVTAIGVCNFLPEHLERLAAETGVMPEVNQIELHPYFPQADMLEFHRRHGILTEAWSPLGRGNDLLANPIVTRVAERHDATPGQVLLAWSIARGAIPLPKAASVERQRENLAAAELVLEADEVDEITALGRPDGRLAGQDPAHYEEF
ncbi:MAG: aldo/keto reductase [Micrococcales bacterium]|nr:aldo/keto reductase [Micrococcales bacterium]OJX69840.1 MAG: 2,5-diketo-D-gluconic acid reductase [Micrococcales bacterium 72-143]